MLSASPHPPPIDYNEVSSLLKKKKISTMMSAVHELSLDLEISLLLSLIFQNIRIFYIVISLKLYFPT